MYAFTSKKMMMTLGLGAALTVLGCQGNKSSTVEVKTYLSADGTNGLAFAVNSHLIVGETEAVLVDGQILAADAHKVVDLIAASGKLLTTVFLTHAHPDHYVGMDVIKTAFPNAKFVTTPAVLAEYDAKKDDTFAYLKQAFGAAIPDKLVPFQALSGTTLVVDNHRLEVLEAPSPGESTASAALAIPETKSLISGDQLYSKIHLWLADCHSADGWRQNIELIRSQGYDKLYAGHGPTPATAAILDDDEGYLATVAAIFNAAASADEVVNQVESKFPQWGGAALLAFEAQTYFQRCKTP